VGSALQFAFTTDNPLEVEQHHALIVSINQEYKKVHLIVQREYSGKHFDRITCQMLKPKKKAEGFLPSAMLE